jgi:Cys-tRNA(Pro)/Cys-tRNA(Cys) deacylase
MSTTRKTNALRILESLGVPHQVAEHEVGEEHFDAERVAALLGVSPDILFKTLVASAGPQEVLVFCIPGNAELDLRKAARAAGVRRIDLVPLKDLTPLTGYVRGGCSPVGMKKKFPTWVDESASLLPSMYVNAGARGLQVNLAPADLLRATGAVLADLCAD